jgi:hypothetical protein
LIAIVDGLQVFPNLKGLIEVNISRLITSVTHDWIVGITLILGSEAIVIFGVEHATWFAGSVF